MHARAEWVGGEWVGVGRMYVLCMYGGWVGGGVGGNGDCRNSGVRYSADGHTFAPLKHQLLTNQGKNEQKTDRKLLYVSAILMSLFCFCLLL